MVTDFWALFTSLSKHPNPHPIKKSSKFNHELQVSFIKFLYSDNSDDLVSHDEVNWMLLGTDNPEIFGTGHQSDPMDSGLFETSFGSGLSWAVLVSGLLFLLLEETTAITLPETNSKRTWK